MSNKNFDYISNWRSISLLNIESIADRLEKDFNQIIDYDQTDFMNDIYR
jgi:hypothetical protein